jgi:L-alanine-DL-glutamate epimerase-like enolase superfamily enzyme
VFDVVNIKLMKCTGMAEAHRMILEARRLGLRIMLGCMTETSCGISAAAQLAPLVDWADLDGALLIANDPFAGATVRDGRITMPEGDGIGIKRAGILE